MAPYCSSPVKLTLAVAGATVDLLDGAQGFRLGELDLGYPSVREDSDPQPARHGTVDYTRLFGERAVTITGNLVPSPAGSRQKAWHALAPFLDPAARPVLTYQIDADTTPRTMTLRAAQASGPIRNPSVSPVALGFKCADPFAYDASSHQAIVYVYTVGIGAGRAYNLVPPRVYPAGGPNNATAYNYGDFRAYPLLRFYGPITGARATFASTPAALAAVVFLPSYIISGGHYVEVDCKRRTAFLDGDPTQSVSAFLDYTAYQEVWPWIVPGAPAGYTNITLQGSGYSSSTQLVAIWSDPYLL